MNGHRFISKRAFQVFALLTLIVCVGLTIYWVVTDTGLYRLVLDGWEALGKGMTGKVLAGLGTFLALFVVWLLIVVPVRKFSRMPTLEEELGQEVDGLSSLVAGLGRMFEREVARNEELYRAREPLTPEMKRRARMIGLGFMAFGLAFGIGAALSLIVSLELGRLFVFQVILAILSLALFLAGLYQLITGRSVIRR